jgi:hypothetical protein
MKLKRKHWFVIVGIVVIALFFYPKECGNWGTAIHPNAKYKDCTCIGIKYSPPLVGGAPITCYGIPTSYSCYYYKEAQKIEIPCE